SELHERLGISEANLSQHLAVLRGAGVIATRRTGKQVHCYLAIPEVKQACALISDVLRAQVKNGQRLGAYLPDGYFCFLFRSLSVIHVHARVAAGSPKVVMESNATCSSSSVLTPLLRAFLTAEWVAPSRPAPIESANFKSRRVFSSRGPA